MKNLTGFSKGLIMTIITLIASSFSNGGFPAHKTSWIILGVTMLGTILVYCAKNYLFPSISLFGTIDLRDLISGLIMGIGTALSTWAGSAVAGVPLDWHTLWQTVIGVVLGYFSKNFITKNPALPNN